MLTALSPGPGSGVVSVRISGWDQVLTCRDKKDACAEDDVVPAAVELAGGHTEPAEEEQRDAEDGEDAGGPHSPCGEKERAVWSQPAWVPEEAGVCWAEPASVWPRDQGLPRALAGSSAVAP